MKKFHLALKWKFNVGDLVCHRLEPDKPFIVDDLIVEFELKKDVLYKYRLKNMDGSRYGVIEENHLRPFKQN